MMNFKEALNAVTDAIMADTNTRTYTNFKRDTIAALQDMCKIAENVKKYESFYQTEKSAFRINDISHMEILETEFYQSGRKLTKLNFMVYLKNNAEIEVSKEEFGSLKKFLCDYNKEI